MDAYCAVIKLHSLGYQLKVLNGTQIAIRPTVKEEHTELIRAIRKETQAACRAIQHLPHLCAVVVPAEPWLRRIALGVFQAMKETGYGRIIAIRYFTETGATEYVFQPLHPVAEKALQDFIENEWGECYECQKEGQRRRKRIGAPPV